jgi:hypothetical protein
MFGPPNGPDHGAMIESIPRRLRLAFTRTTPSTDGSVETSIPPAQDEVDFVAYGVDCVLSGRAVLDGDRLTDMLNDHDEYVLIDVTVERFDGGPSITVPEVVVPRDELWLIHATGPRGDSGRRHRTAQQHVALKVGPYSVRGFYHALPGSDPATAITRRKPMVPITRARIEYEIGGETREVLVDAVIVNRYQVDWIEATEPDRGEFPAGPKRVAKPAPGTAVVAHRT